MRRVPTGTPFSVARCAWQQSSTIASAWRSATRRDRRHVSWLPVEMDGNDRLRSSKSPPRRTRPDRASASSGSTSTMRGIAPHAMTASPVNAAVKAGTITSSPGPMSSARSASVIASVPLPTPTANRAPHADGELGLECFDLRTEHEPAALDHAGDRRRSRSRRLHQDEGR